jgi:hypothetical protein
MLEESFRVVTGDDETPPEKAVPAFMNKSKLDVDPFCLNYPPPDRDAWKELRGMSRCTKLYICHDIDKVETWKFYILAWFTEDVAVSYLSSRLSRRLCRFKGIQTMGKTRRLSRDDRTVIEWVVQ